MGQRSCVLTCVAFTAGRTAAATAVRSTRSAAGRRGCRSSAGPARRTCPGFGDLLSEQGTPVTYSDGSAADIRQVPLTGRTGVTVMTS
ncbi:hypothetical protein [Streptomyces sp. NPDC055681]